MLSETVANSLSGNKPYGGSGGGVSGGSGSGRKGSGSPDSPGCRPGVVTVVDVQSVVDPQVTARNHYPDFFVFPVSVEYWKGILLHAVSLSVIHIQNTGL